MTVNELKNNIGFDFEVNMDKSYADKGSTDEWGSAFVWVGNIGVEYNYCIDGDLNESAIYAMYDTITGYTETDYCHFIHYEVEWSEPDWEERLINAMCEALIELHNL